MHGSDKQQWPTGMVPEFENSAGIACGDVTFAIDDNGRDATIVGQSMAMYVDCGIDEFGVDLLGEDGWVS